MLQRALERRQGAAPARERQTEAPAVPGRVTVPAKRRSREPAGTLPPVLKIPGGPEPPGLEAIPLREADPEAALLEEAPETALLRGAIQAEAAVHLEILQLKSRIHTKT